MYRSRFAFALTLAGLAAILLPSFLHAQITFQRTYGGPSLNIGCSVQQTADGGYVIVGYTGVAGSFNDDVYLVRTDAYGDTQWTRTYGGTHDDGGYSVRQTSDGGYIVAGVTASFGAGGCDVYLIKTDAQGDTLWTRTCGGSGDDEGYAVLQTADGDYIIAGLTASFGAGGYDVYLIKTDAQGDTLWTRTYGGAGDEKGYAVQQTADSGYIITGSTDSSGAGHTDEYLIRTDANGELQWARTYSSAGCSDCGQSVSQTTDGGYIVAGTSESYGLIVGYVYLVKVNASGDTEWTKTYGGGIADLAYSVQQTTDGGFVIAGMTASVRPGNPDVYLLKTDSGGDTLWTRIFGGSAPDWGYSVQQTSDGGFVIAGKTESYGAGWDYVYLIKTDSLGNVAVEEPKPNPPPAPALSLACEPNPCRGATTIRLSPFALGHSPLTLRMYDSQGRMVLTRQVRTSSFPLSTSDLPCGAYFIRCDAAGEHATARIVLQR